MPASYSLGTHFEQFVQRQLRSGRYASASEVVREGLRLMEEREAERQARLESLRAEIARGRESGPGIPAPKRELIFQPYFTDKRDGTGLGLAIVRQTIEQHKGTITVADNVHTKRRYELV